ncbi:MAG: metal-dependent hydrolase [Parvularculales bacterium]
MKKRKDTASDHPMDDFPVRPLDFDIDGLSAEDCVWSDSAPQFSVFINALGLHVPYFERYLVRTMNTVKHKVADDTLRRDMVALSGQEGHHARNFIAFNKLMARRYPKAGKLDAAAKAHFDHAARHDSEKRMVGFTAGYETFTFLAGLIILRNYDKWMADSHPVMKALWVWHQVEEVEHGAVAHDVYRALYGGHEWYRKYMVVAAGWHIAGETVKAYAHMARIEGWLKNPFGVAKYMGFCFRTLADMAWQTIPVFRKNYNPRNHPLANRQQSPVAIAWRKHDAAGGDVLAIDRTAMSRIMQLR